MLTNISWTDYLIAVALSVTGYYLFVGIKYFSSEIKGLLSGNNKIQHSGLSEDPSSGKYFPVNENPEPSTTAFEQTSDDEFDQLDQLIGRLKTIIEGASIRKASIQELKQYLHLVLQEYPGIKNSALRSSINELVASECEKYDAVRLSEEEVEMLWNAAK